MRVQIKLNELTLANAALVATSQQIDRALKSAVDASARDIRRDLLMKAIQQATGLKRKLLNDRLALRYDRPKGRKGSNIGIGVLGYSARIVPSAKGIKATEFRDVGMEMVNASRNRARATVPWVDGTRKVIAGFINPKGKARHPIRTRNRNGKLKQGRTALAPSVASMVKDMDTSSFAERASRILQERFDLALAKELKR